ncbi:leucyl/phenylalanyl-tRNA--protein transferase [Marinobacterium mangrovicola]|uniref:Leucyl/phenylalanyl-tRNA--protein transferase n=1 Tax=Marinobacterium mangrovicola TaxID=1476959 RepID=A0A4R1GPV2_9GAMM|nr:leucyl/phenylalanyl-tRNA--protein transferase [Marinobacterium mangrovicola]TCK09383.1 leucyl/phenylalanyl-tRNA--protein transferase [Marinobacterium mangrovicola]
MIPWLHPTRHEFPPVDQALESPNGLLAAGGDLSPHRILNAYRNGIFPWYNADEPILWWSPNPRCVLFPEEIHISRSLRKKIRRGEFKVTFDHSFAQVIDACAAPRQYSEDTWIGRDIKNAYISLHRMGIAHSVEVWESEELVGGLYGLAMGKIFFGESMFSRRTDASKIGFAHLVEHLKNWGYDLIDCQVYNDHLASLGAREIPREEFILLLNKLLEPGTPHEWNATQIYQNKGGEHE